MTSQERLLGISRPPAARSLHVVVVVIVVVVQETREQPITQYHEEEDTPPALVRHTGTRPADTWTRPPEHLAVWCPGSERRFLLLVEGDKARLFPR